MLAVADAVPAEVAPGPGEHEDEEEADDALPEVEGFEGTLIEAFEQGFLSAPTEPLPWNQWQAWRSGEGLRPTTARRFTTSQRQAEAALWRSTMAGLFGEGWNARANALGKAAAAAKKRAAPSQPPGLTAPARPEEPRPERSRPQRALSPAPGLSGDPGSSPPAPSESGSGLSEASMRSYDTASILRLLQTEYDPDRGTLELFERRSLRFRLILRGRRVKFDEAAPNRVLARAHAVSRALAWAPDQEWPDAVSSYLNHLMDDETDGSGIDDQEIELLLDVQQIAATANSPPGQTGSLVPPAKAPVRAELSGPVPLAEPRTPVRRSLAAPLSAALSAITRRGAPAPKALS